MRNLKLGIAVVSLAVTIFILSNCFGAAQSGLVYSPKSLLTAQVNGTIGSDDIGVFEAYMAANPDTILLEFGELPGSVDDKTNLQLAKRVRARGLHTHLTSTSGAYSGGADLFIAGVERTMECGAEFGVHSWAGETYTGRDLPRDPNHPEHSPYIEYYQQMGLPDPAGFYFFTLDAAPAEGIHVMTPDEINQFGITTHQMNCES